MKQNLLNNCNFKELIDYKTNNLQNDIHKARHEILKINISFKFSMDYTNFLRPVFTILIK